MYAICFCLRAHVRVCVCVCVCVYVFVGATVGCPLTQPTVFTARTVSEWVNSAPIYVWLF